jgi:SMODS-associating 4TM effector domain
VTAPRPSISQRQNDPDMIEMLRAAFASHTRGQRLEAGRVVVSLLLATLGLVAAFVDKAAAPVAIAGAAWAAIYSVGVFPWERSEARRGAVIQEMFDVELFGLPWNLTAAGAPFPPYEISKLARRFTPGRGRGGRLRDWYVDSSGVAQPYDIFLCQEQNLGWDSRLRRRWAATLLAFVITWALLGLLVGYVAGLTVVEALLRWYLPAAVALLLGIDGYKTHREVAEERERIIPVLQAEVDAAQRPPLPPGEGERLARTAREIQDVILATRREAARVPQWFYARFRDDDERDFQANADRLRKRLAEA